MLHDLKTIISGQIHAKQLELYMDAMDVTNEDVYCDKLRLNQILLNLCPMRLSYSGRRNRFCPSQTVPGKAKGSELYEFG